MNNEKKEAALNLFSKTLAGIVSLLLYIPFSKFAEKYILKDFSQGIRETVVFGATSVIAAYIIMKLGQFVIGPTMEIKFENRQKRTLYEVEFIQGLDDPQFIDIIFIGKFTKFQLKILQKFKAKIKVFSSGDILVFELDNGFSQADSGSELVLDVIDRFHASKSKTAIHQGVQIAMVSRGEVELLMELDFTQCRKMHSFIIKKWYKFEDFDLKIKG